MNVIPSTIMALLSVTQNTRGTIGNNPSHRNQSCCVGPNGSVSMRSLRSLLRNHRPSKGEETRCEYPMCQSC